MGANQSAPAPVNKGGRPVKSNEQEMQELLDQRPQRTLARLPNGDLQEVDANALLEWFVKKEELEKTHKKREDERARKQAQRDALQQGDAESAKEHDKKLLVLLFLSLCINLGFIKYLFVSGTSHANLFEF
ncbi:unnamed protein product [Amoebophrya sp. A120]|nr:unnamed protein product [Amoebophrya sp. A120]|eukprot:GSA120T00023799001.1